MSVADVIRSCAAELGLEIEALSQPHTEPPPTNDGHEGHARHYIEAVIPTFFVRLVDTVAPDEAQTLADALAPRLADGERTLIHIFEGTTIVELVTGAVPA